MRYSPSPLSELAAEPPRQHGAAALAGGGARRAGALRAASAASAARVPELDALDRLARVLSRVQPRAVARRSAREDTEGVCARPSALLPRAQHEAALLGGAAGTHQTPLPKARPALLA